MPKFAIIRLGKDSVADIKAINALTASPAVPLTFDVKCSQVPQELETGDYAFICLGSDNNQGSPTDWVRGVRALGTVTNKSGGPGYNDSWVVSLEVKVALPASVTKKELLAIAPNAYFWASDIPVLGVDTHSNQTVQMIKTAEPHQKIEALVYGLNSIHPRFGKDTVAAYPALAPMFTYVPPAPTGSAAALAATAAATAASGTKGSIDISKIVKQFKDDADVAELRIDVDEAHRFFASLLSKRFLIATGLAGSGKTKLAQAFAAWITRTVSEAAPAKCYEVVSIGADWTGNENILGYANGLDEKSYVSKPALDLVLRALGDPEAPYVLILDEMNLSHVERYFADVLSVLESDEKINLHKDPSRKSQGVVVPNEIELPKNLFIIGTVNVDETTYMFSPKVLDRASVIEFRMEADELAAFLANPSKPNLSMIAGKGAAFGPAFVAGARSQVPNFAPPLKGQYEAEMLLFFNALRGNGAEFGYRVAHEAARFIHFYKGLGAHADADPLWFARAFDCLVAQKFLPKLHGSRAKLAPLLKKLWFLCVADAAARGGDAFAAAEAAAKSTEKLAEPSSVVPDGAPYAVSAEKISRMWRLLNDNGFASFAEA
ncbi:McrB family protein [Caenimonas soli]|uniref:McrB family protein n=1 Tax=Caenimonas soli TaxID=2735555 RepID=UPI0015558040|nr:hypothetical protein [Caenimonas soli]NPC55188.1 hypothetical protein [Caenimonas soli]